MSQEETTQNVSHEFMLDDLIRKHYDVLKDRAPSDARIGDYLKMIELRRKLTPGNDDQKEFWKMIDEIRRSRSEAGKADKKPKKRSATGKKTKK